MGEPHDQDVALADPIVTTKSKPKSKESAETRTRKEPPYNVIILNDEDHTFDYVIELLCKLFRHPVETAERLTLEVHLRGRAIVMTTHKEHAELKRDQVLAYGPDPRLERSAGPIGCVIEPAE
jgi:ATP-dependent Clp protease adaptor protein ClpS